MGSLFKIGENDYTMNITVPSYKVNSVPVYTEWTDGNFVVHRNIHRKSIEGSFTLKFYNSEEYYSFLDDIKEHTNTDGTVYASLYSNNDDDFTAHYVFITFDLQDEIPIIGMVDFEGFEVTIKER